MTMRKKVTDVVKSPARGIAIQSPSKSIASPARGIAIQSLSKSIASPTKIIQSPANNVTQDTTINTRVVKNATKIYSDNEINSMLDGHINIHPGMWDWIPSGAHIRYFRKGQEAHNERFRIGGFVKSHFTNDEGKKFLMMENMPCGRSNKVVGYVKFPLAYEDIDELWKKYDKNAFIEIHLISASLAQKKKQIDDLQDKMSKMESILSAVVDRISGKT